MAAAKMVGRLLERYALSMVEIVSASNAASGSRYDRRQAAAPDQRLRHCDRALL